MTKCYYCGWLNISQEQHAALVREAWHLRIDHGLSRRKTARRMGVREVFVRDHVDKWAAS